MQTLGELRMRDTANCWAGLFVCVYSRSLPLVARGESDWASFTVVDSMRNSIHAIRWYTERADQVASAIMHIGFFACFHGISLERSRFRKIALLLFRHVRYFIGMSINRVFSVYFRVTPTSPNDLRRVGGVSPVASNGQIQRQRRQ